MGNKGLDEAVENFKASNDTKLSTYATWWNREEIKGLISGK